MKSVQFYLRLNRQQALRYYQGTARSVVVSAENGQRLQFPAEHIRPFIDQYGVQGRFEISFDDANKMIGIKRV